MPDPTKVKTKGAAKLKTQVAPSQANLRNMKKVSPDYDSTVGTVSDYWKNKRSFTTKSGAKREFTASTSLDHYKQTGEIIGQSGGQAMRLKGSDASHYAKQAFQSIGSEREKAYNTMMRNVGSGAGKMMNMLGSKDKQGIVKPK